MSQSIVITTCAETAEAEALAMKIMEQKLAAAVQFSQIQSIYEWNGKLCNRPEIKLTIKTRSELYPKLEACIVENHRYEVPQIIELPIQSGLKAYLNWIDEATQK